MSDSLLSEPLAGVGVLSVAFPSLTGMNHLNPALTLTAVVLWGILASGCSAGSAAMSPSDCRPGDQTMACCIKKYPYDPVGACGATASDIEQVQRSVRADEDEDDFANNASLPAWKQRCIRYYNDCKNLGWTGKCDDCLRHCEGQLGEWPFNWCKGRGK